MDIETIEMIFSVVVYVFVFLFGVTIGSFLNVCIYRLPKGESLITNNSHCMTCGTPIKRYDLIPIISWIILRGKCRACGAKIPARYTIVEAMTAVMFVLCYAFFPYESFGIYFALLALFISGLIVLAFQDLDTQEMCVSVLIYTAIIAVITHVLACLNITTSMGTPLLTLPITLKEGIIGAVCVSSVIIVIGFVITPVVYMLFISQDHKDRRRLKKAIKAAANEREASKLQVKLDRVNEKIKAQGPVFGFGMGDAVVMATGGLMLGWKAAVTAGITAVITGAVYGIIKRAVSDDEESESAFAFGPFLIIGLVIGAYFGADIIDAYIAFTFG